MHQHTNAQHLQEYNIYTIQSLAMLRLAISFISAAAAYRCLFGVRRGLLGDPAGGGVLASTIPAPGVVVLDAALGRVRVGDSEPRGGTVGAVTVLILLFWAAAWGSCDAAAGSFAFLGPEPLIALFHCSSNRSGCAGASATFSAPSSSSQPFIFTAPTFALFPRSLLAFLSFSRSASRSRCRITLHFWNTPSGKWLTPALRTSLCG